MYDVITERIARVLKEKNAQGIQEVVDILQHDISHYSWVGIYVVKGDMLHLGPWTGAQATEHVKIPVGSGICGSAAQTGDTEIIGDVQKDDRYLSCFVSTKSEIVVPIRFNERIVGEIDIDSDQKDAFSKQDAVFLEHIADMLGPHIYKL